MNRQKTYSQHVKNLGQMSYEEKIVGIIFFLQPYLDIQENDQSNSYFCWTGGCSYRHDRWLIIVFPQQRRKVSLLEWEDLEKNFHGA
ncbi:MAG: hypothetical protein CM15mP58_13550 [Burkholderiaceae bacterium]|nr:MAG: hypothetical protein CM15mP58_13550 [Burkholderiaceae bacterium]